MRAENPKRNLRMVPGRAGMPTLDDDQCVQECLAGNWQAFDVLVRKYRDRVGHVISRLLDDERDVEDAVQDTFLDAYRALLRYQASGRFEQWLLRLAINHARDHRRSRWFRRVLHLEDLADRDSVVDPDSALSSRGSSPEALARDGLGHLRQRALRRALSQLRERERVALVLRYYASYSTPEIAAILQIREGSVGPTIVRACERLRCLLNPLYEEETK